MGAVGAGPMHIAESRLPCPICEGATKVQKTVPRLGRTLTHGPFEAQETVYECAGKCRWPSGARVVQHAACLQESLMPGSVIGYDVMVFVGLNRFVHHNQREEIRSALFEQYGVKISTGEVSALSRRFLQYLERLHRARAPQLRAAIEADGGWPMHVDATGEAGRGTLLVVIAGWRKWVLGSWKIATERADLILPCLRQVVRLFGPPCAAMRDLGKAVTPAIEALVSGLKLDIPVLACHQHFLADVGKDLLEPSHAQLRDLFRRTKIRPRLRTLIRDLGRRIGKNIHSAREALQKWRSAVDSGHKVETGTDGLAEVRALAQWVLDFKADASGLDFPFDRPYLDFYNRCNTALRASDAFLRNPPPDKDITACLRRFHRILEAIECDVPFRRITKRLRHRAALFDELRAVLRMAETLPEKETEQDLNQMRDELNKWVDLIRQRRPARGPAVDIREAIDLILKHIDAHGNNLWGQCIQLPKGAGGGIRLVSRTNETAENFFKGFKHDERRRSGRKNLGQDLESLPAEAALAYNLKHDDYVSILCGSLDDLPEAFAELDRNERNDKLLGVKSNAEEQECLEDVLQIASASLCSADRQIIRTEEMDRRITAAAQSRASRRCG
jgi:hypothetical protein